MKNNDLPRRNFLKWSGYSLAATPLVGVPSVLNGSPNEQKKKQTTGKDWTIQQVIDLIMEHIPGGRREKSVDTFKTGNPNHLVKGVVSTFLATAEVIQQAAWLGANLIITHEPTFYNHWDETDWLQKDPVYQYKRELLDKHEIVVWRFHDYWHRHRPDGILHGFLKDAGWLDYEDKTRENICVLPSISLKDLAAFIKKQFQLKRTFYIGDPDLECRNVGLLLGAMGGRNHMNFLRDNKVEALVVGESPEWETVEYIRDAAFAGMKKGLIIIGHARSEEPGMKWLVEWLQPKIPGVKVAHIEAGDPFMPV